MRGEWSLSVSPWMWYGFMWVIILFLLFQTILLIWISYHTLQRFKRRSKHRRKFRTQIIHSPHTPPPPALSGEEIKVERIKMDERIKVGE